MTRPRGPVARARSSCPIRSASDPAFEFAPHRTRPTGACPGIATMTLGGPVRWAWAFGRADLRIDFRIHKTCSTRGIFGCPELDKLIESTLSRLARFGPTTPKSIDPQLLRSITPKRARERSHLPSGGHERAARYDPPAAILRRCAAGTSDPKARPLATPGGRRPSSPINRTRGPRDRDGRPIYPSRTLG